MMSTSKEQIAASQEASAVAAGPASQEADMIVGAWEAEAQYPGGQPYFVVVVANVGEEPLEPCRQMVGAAGEVVACDETTQGRLGFAHHPLCYPADALVRGCGAFVGGLDAEHQGEVWEASGHVLMVGAAYVSCCPPAALGPLADVYPLASAVAWSLLGTVR